MSTSQRIQPRPVLDALPVTERVRPKLPILDVYPVHALAPVELPILDALPVWDQPTPPPAVGIRGMFRAFWWYIGASAEWVFGTIALTLGLAILSAIPVIQFLTLGYLLEIGGRVARTGRFRDAFVGIRKAARVGSIVLGTWILLLPLWLVSYLSVSAQLIDPDGAAAKRWTFALNVLTVLIIVRIVAACSRGGKLRYFLLPYFNTLWLLRRLLKGGYYTQARDAVWNFAVSLRLPYYFWLGFRGFIGTLAWLVIPVSMIALGGLGGVVDFRGQVAKGLFLFAVVMAGWFLLSLVLIYLPFLQIHFARENRLRAFLEVRAVREDFRRAPVAFAFSFFVTLLFALPLYLMKIEMIPREAAWLESLVFLAFIYPSRLLTAWAYGRSTRRMTPRHWFFRWPSRLSTLPIAAAYVFIIFFTQYTSWNGIYSLYDQHAFLLPVPFLNLSE